MRAINGSVRKAVVRALACASGLIVIPGLANADPAQFDIVAQPLPNALKAFAVQAKMQLLYRYDIVSHANASAVAGKLEKHAALEQMLRGTGLEAVYSNENTATIRLVAPDAKPAATKAATSEKPGTPAAAPTGATTGDRIGYVRLAQADNGVQTTPNGPNSNVPDVPDIQEVVVTGVRQALETSQEFKKDAATFVDSITATDIGAFPDKSASDALQRVPGITVNRLQSNDDSTHPSGEPTNILIRGLTQVRTEFNGRDTFSADSGRGLNFNDISPELLSRADAYKNQTADMIEGGIAGTIDLRTRLPFDQEGHVLVGEAQGDYGDRSKQATPAYSVLGSDSVWTDVGRFGLLADYARSHVITRTQSVIDDKIDTYCSAGYGTAAHAIVNSDGSIPCTSNPFGGTGWAFAPDGIRYSQVDYDRNRIGSTIAAQYETNDKNLLATIQYDDSSYHNAWLENASHAILEGTYFGTPAFDPRNTTILGPADGTGPLVFGSDGMLQSGVLTQPHGSWLGSYSPNIQDAINTGSAIPGVPFVNDCGPGFTCATQRDGLYFQDEARDFDHREDTKDLSGNVHWDITDRLHSDFDAQYVRPVSRTTTSWWPPAQWPTTSTVSTVTARPRSISSRARMSTTPPAACPIRTTTGFLSSRATWRMTTATNPPSRWISNMTSRIAGSIRSRPACATPTATRRCAIPPSTGPRSRPTGTATGPVSMPTTPPRGPIPPVLRVIRTSWATAPESGVPPASTRSMTAAFIRTATWSF
jgi:hypothetical protein